MKEVVCMPNDRTSDWGRVNVLDPVGASTQRRTERGKMSVYTGHRQSGPDNDRTTGESITNEKDGFPPDGLGLSEEG